VVKPIRFPGGSIGDLAVNGTVNDLAVAGARPLALSLSLILEEGLPAAELRQEVEAIAAAAEAAGVRIIAGDTKVVERGHADAMYACTTGVGVRDPRASLSPQSLRPGDRVLLSGSVGEHGTAIMLARGEFELDAAIESDTRSLWPVADALLDDAGVACLSGTAFGDFGEGYLRFSVANSIENLQSALERNLVAALARRTGDVLAVVPASDALSVKHLGAALEVAPEEIPA